MIVRWFKIFKSRAAFSTGITIGTNSEGAFKVAEKLRVSPVWRSLETSMVEFGFAVTISCGVATVGDDSNSRDSLLQSADAAVYKAKSEARNRTLRSDSLQSFPIEG
jgi:diguanylate cyclase (GGDEF)-like protein